MRRIAAILCCLSLLSLPGCRFAQNVFRDAVYEEVPCKRAFVIMGFNYERGVDCMLHDLCHRTEATMSRIYNGWKAEELTTSWARFAANLKQSGTAAIASCHYPPNAEADYDYANKRQVESTADDWLSYPAAIGKEVRGLVRNVGRPRLPAKLHQLVVCPPAPRRGDDCRWPPQ